MCEIGKGRSIKIGYGNNKNTGWTLNRYVYLKKPMAVGKEIAVWARPVVWPVVSLDYCILISSNRRLTTASVQDCCSSNTIHSPSRISFEEAGETARPWIRIRRPTEAHFPTPPPSPPSPTSLPDTTNTETQTGVREGWQTETETDTGESSAIVGKED